MISFNHQAILVRVPKTAGTSMAAALKSFEVGKPHRNILQIRDAVEAARQAGRLPPGSQLPPDWFDRFYKFGFVRNPWSRTVSMYKRKEGIQMADRMSFDEFVDWIDCASATCIHPSRHRNQLDWFTDTDGNVLVDYIGKFETLNEDWEKICSRLSVQAFLGHRNHNPSNNRPYTEYYTERTREIIRRKFAVDIDYFGYEFEA